MKTIFNPLTGSLQQTDGWITRKFSFTSAQILALNSAPQQVLPAPGANKAYQLNMCIVKMNFLTAAYATNLTLALVNDTVNKIALASNANILNATVTRITQLLLATTPSTLTVQQVMADTPLYLTVATGNPTAGGGSLDIWVNYRIVDVS